MLVEQSEVHYVLSLVGRRDLVVPRLIVLSEGTWRKIAGCRVTNRMGLRSLGRAAARLYLGRIQTLRRSEDVRRQRVQAVWKRHAIDAADRAVGTRLQDDWRFPQGQQHGDPGGVRPVQSLCCSFQGTAFLLRIDPLKRLNRRSRAVPGNMDC